MTKIEFKAEHRFVRTEARRRANLAKGRSPGFASRVMRLPNHGLISINAERHHRPEMASAVKIQFPTIIDRPIRQRIADDLRWAAIYRRDALTAHRQRNEQLKRVYIVAAKACLDDARALQTAFARLP
jgi:hypothetical protein